MPIVRVEIPQEARCSTRALAPKLSPKIGADFWEGDVTMHFSVKKSFPVKRAEVFSE